MNGGQERGTYNSRFGFSTTKISYKTGPVAPPRSSPKKVVESSSKVEKSHSVTSKVVESTSSLKEANQNIKGLSTLVKEQNSSTTFLKSRFGFKPGIFNNRNASSKNNEKVTKVIENVDSLGRRVEKVNSLVKRNESSQAKDIFSKEATVTREGGLRKEYEYISSGNSNDSNLSGSSISSSASDSAPQSNRNLVDCNSNRAPAQGHQGLPGPSVVPPAKPLRAADRRGLISPPLKSQTTPQRATAPPSVLSQTSQERRLPSEQPQESPEQLSKPGEQPEESEKSKTKAKAAPEAKLRTLAVSVPGNYESCSASYFSLSLFRLQI